jgi:hypothetical protein
MNLGIEKKKIVYVSTSFFEKTRDLNFILFLEEM